MLSHLDGTGIPFLTVPCCQSRAWRASGRSGAGTEGRPLVSAPLAGIRDGAAGSTSLNAGAMRLAFGPRWGSGMKSLGLSPEADATGGGDWAICCSGGGIRSAAYCLGALQSLDLGGLLGTAKWILGVSGGSYIASSPALVAHDLPSGTGP